MFGAIGLILAAVITQIPLVEKIITPYILLLVTTPRLNFPNFTGFSGQVLSQGPDRDVNEIMIKAYNDWHVDEWCGSAPGRRRQGGYRCRP